MAWYGAKNTRTLAAITIPVLPVAPPLTMAPTETSTALTGAKSGVVGTRLPHFAPVPATLA